MTPLRTLALALTLSVATTHAFAIYPGNSLGYASAPQSLMWNRADWKLTWHSSISIPFTGGWRPQPIVQLQQRSTGALIYWINVHFSARRANQADRDKAMRILLRSITTPTLFQCGEADANVPCLGAEQMYQALRSRNVPTQLVVYPGESHGLTVPSYLKDRMMRNLARYTRFLKRAER